MSRPNQDLGDSATFQTPPSLNRRALPDEHTIQGLKPSILQDQKFNQHSEDLSRKRKIHISQNSEAMYAKTRMSTISTKRVTSGSFYFYYSAQSSPIDNST